MKKRIVSLLMAVLMLVTMLPVAAMAEELTMTDPTEEQVVSGETTPDPSEEPETPEEPEEPDQPGEPEQPEQPEEPETPQEPEQPAENDPEEAAPDNENDIALFAGEGGSVTRIAWVQMLVSAFDMTVEEDNYPDNYYTDIDSTAAYYRDLMVAVEFGVIDLEAGLPFEPEEPATREFAAHTLNYCLGFQLDSSTYTYTDTADVTYKDDVQVAVNRGWFALVNGKFLPQQAMTSAEAQAMLADAAQVLEGTVVSENYNSTYTFKTDVIEIPAGTEVQVEDGVVRITDCPKPLTNGCIFVVYVNEIPVPYIATAVAVDGNVTVVTATRAEDADAFEVFDAQGVVDADLTLVEALDGTELSYYVEELDQEFQTYAMAQAAVARIGGTKEYNHALNLKRDIPLGNNVSLNLNIKAKNLKVSYNINLRQGTAYVGLSCDVTTTFKIKGDFLPATCINDINDIELFYWKIPGVGGFTITYDVKLAGEISGVHESHVSLGIQASVKNGISFPREFETKSFSISIEATMQIGFIARLGVTELPAVSGYFYAKFGIAARLKGTTYKDDRTPKTCIHFGAYLYGKCGVTASISFPAFQYKETFDRSYEIFNERNSPLRIIHHYEDNVLVPSCTRADEFEGDLGRWRTPGTSRYTSSGWSSGFGGNGYDKDGNPVTLYTYKLDDDDNATITAYKGNATAVVIPSKLVGYTVVAIGNKAFRSNNNLRAVTIPDTITSIGDWSFSECKKLSDVTLSANLISLGDRAFGDCTSLTSITIPKTLKTAYAFGPFNGCSALTNVTLEQGMTVVAPNLFYNCSGLVSIKIPDTVTSIGDSSFRNCESLKNVEIPDSVTEIKDSAFRYSANLEKIVIPDTVTVIGAWSFSECKKLSDVTLSANLVSLGDRAFGDCTSLTSITIPKTLKTAYAFGPFNGCSALTNVTLEQGMTVVAPNLFYNCSGLVSIKIPDTVTSIGNSSFRNCESLKNVEIPDSVTEIKDSAFRYSANLEKIVIPNTVTVIGAWSFSECKKLSDVTLSANLVSLGDRAFGDCTSLTSITIPKTLKTAYAFGPFNGCSALTNVTLEQGMTVVAPNLFYNCSGLVSIKIPDTVTSIGNSSFRNCESLKNVEIPDSVTEIKDSAFRYSANLEKIVIPDTVTSMGDYVFYGCKKLSEVKLPNTRKNIMQSMFQDCTSLKTIILPDTVTTIQMNAFSGCTALETIVFPDSLTSIQGSAFLDCSSLKNVTWSKNLTSIDSSAFSNCSALETLELPISVTTLGYGAFSNCDGLTTIIVPDSVTKLGTQVFYDCDALTSVKLGSGITTIPESTFEHCDALESIVIPRRVTTIGNTAFKDCVKFTSITIPRSVTSISGNAFSYPAKMTIYGVAGTYAETFANANNIKFVDKQVNATAVTLSRKELTLSKGASATLFLTVTPEDFTDEVSWKSGNTSVVTVNDAGVIKAVGLGTATIKVMVGNVSASCKVTVQQPVTSISLNKTSLTLEALATYQLTATAYPNNAVDRRVSWSSSAPDIASVDDNGLVTAHKKGSATVTATAMDGSDVTKKCTVTVSNTAYICATVEAMESPHNYPNSCSDFWVYTIPGAEKLRVTFDARTDIEDGFDYLYVFDGTGKQVGKYTGTELAGQTITIPGDTVKLKLVSDGSGNEWGFKVSRISSGTASGTVAGNVTTGGNAADPVTIVFKQNGNTVKTATVSGGSYRVSGLPDGSYTLEASKPGCVPRSYTVTVKDGEVVNSPNVVLVATGNVNGVSVSGEDVEITDVACLYRYLTSNDRSQSSIPDEAYFLAVADVNSDGAVDVYDLQLLYETVSGIAKT